MVIRSADRGQPVRLRPLFPMKFKIMFGLAAVAYAVILYWALVSGQAKKREIEAYYKAIVQRCIDRGGEPIVELGHYGPELRQCYFPPK